MRTTAILLLLAGCGATTAPPTDSSVTVPSPPLASASADPAIEARLGCTVITHAQVDEQFHASSKLSDKPPTREEVRAHMIRAVVVAKAARDRELEVAPAEIDAGIVAMAQANKITPEQLLASVREHGIDETKYRAQVAEQVLEAKLRLRLAEGASGSDEIVAKSEPQLERLTKEMMAKPCSEPPPAK